MGMLIKQGKGYTGAALARRRVEVASPRDPDSTAVEKCVGVERGGSEGDGEGHDDVIFLVKGSRGDAVSG